MIGLGTNRLSASRRAGLRETSQFRNGQWMEGGGSWFSPYSKAATRALKAAFPTQWLTIRDYGFEHPKLVPFINEDPMLIVSLVEVGKERWLVGDGYAYINLDIFPLKDEMVELRYIQREKIQSETGYSIFGCRVSNSYFTLQQIGNEIRTSVGSKWIMTSITTQLNTALTIARCNNDVYKNGVKVFRNTSNFIEPTLPMFLFTMNSYGTAEQLGKTINIGIAKFGDRKHLTPFIRKINGVDVCGMLDIISGTFYPNANTTGSFTIQLTDK